MTYLKAIFLAAVVALAVIFMIQNIGPLSTPLSIRLNLIFVHFKSTPYATYLIIMLAFFCGLLLASVLGLMERFRMRKKLKEQRKQIDSLTKELDSLRNLPLTGESLPVAEQTKELPEPEPPEAEVAD